MYDDKKVKMLKKICIKWIDKILSLDYFKLSDQDEVDIFDECRTWYKVISRKENQSASTTVTTYSLSHNFIRQTIMVLAKMDGWYEDLERLDEFNYFSLNNILNYHRSIFGHIINRYLEVHTEIENVEFDKFSSQINVKKFESIFKDIVGMLKENKVRVCYYYFIYGLKLKDASIDIDINIPLTYVPATDSNVEELTKSWYFKLNYNGREMDIYDFITSATGWLKGTIEIDYPRFNIRDRDSFTLKGHQFFPDFVLKEALGLMGHDRIDAKFRTKNARNNFLTIGIQPGISEVFLNTGGYSPDYFRIENSYKFAQYKPEVYEIDSTFIGKYILFRLNYSEDEFINLISNRMLRVFESTNQNDVILDAVIILESFITSSKSELGYQLRLKVPHLLSQDFDRRLKLSTFIKKIYNIRSSIVHNSGIDVRKQISKLGSQGDVLNKVRNLIRLLFLRILQEDEESFILDGKQIIDSIDNGVLRGSIDLGYNDHYRNLHDKLIESIL